MSGFRILFPVTLVTLSCVSAHAVSCFDVEESFSTTQYSLPSFEVQKEQVVAAARALSELGPSIQVHTQLLKELVPHFRNLIEHTRRSWIAQGISSDQVNLFLSRWDRIWTRVSLLEIWHFSITSIEFFPIYAHITDLPSRDFETQILRQLVTWSEQKKGYVLPVPFAVSFQTRSDMFRMGVPPATLNFRSVVSFIDVFRFSYWTNFNHDLSHAGFAFQFLPNAKSKLELVWKSTSGLSPHEERIAYFIRDQLLSDGIIGIFPGKNVRQSILYASEKYYLRSQYWLVNELPWSVSDSWGDWHLMSSQRAFSEKPRVGDRVAVNKPEHHFLSGTVIDRREAVLRELGLPLDMTWAEFQWLVDQTVRSILRNLDQMEAKLSE